MSDRDKLRALVAGNTFGHVQGGFAVAMLDVAISLAGLLKLEQWLAVHATATMAAK